MRVKPAGVLHHTHISELVCHVERNIQHQLLSAVSGNN